MKVREYYLAEINRDPQEVAKECGKVVVYPADNEIQLDIDSEEQYKKFLLTLCKLEKYIDFPAFTVVPSSTPGHCHVTLSMGTPISMWQRLALQSVLCSDPDRELFNCARALTGDERPTLLFAKGTGTKKVINQNLNNN